MTEFLVRRFIKDYTMTEKPQVRARYGVLASLVGICCNVILFAAKLCIGMLVNSISVMADAFNNLSDAASSIIGFVGVKMAQKPADENHPFGHGRIEYITAFIVAFIVIQVGFSLFKTSVGKIRNPEELSFSLVTILILVMSVGVKLWMSVFNRNLGKRIQSAVLIATAADSLGDVGTTSATIISLVVFGVSGINVDGIVGLVVSFAVMWAGVGIAKDTLEPLIGAPIDPQLYRKITNFVESFEGIKGTHDLIVHNYGPSRSMASIHAEVPNDVDIEASHEVIDRIEQEALRRFDIFLVIHMDPVEMKDGRVRQMKLMVEQIVADTDPKLSLHDFRMVDGTERINLIFDLVVPRDYGEEERQELKDTICRLVQERDKRCFCVITAESGFCAEG